MSQEFVILVDGEIREPYLIQADTLEEAQENLAQHLAKHTFIKIRSMTAISEAGKAA